MSSRAGAPDRNEQLRRARESLPSRVAPGEPLSRSELAAAVNEYLWTSTGRRYGLDGHHIAKWERGAVRWPIAAYRAGLRAVLGARRDQDLGFRPSGAGAAEVRDIGTPPATVDSVRVLLRSLQSADRRIGGGYLYATVKHHFDTAIAPQVRAGGSSEMRCAAASALEMAGWMAHDSGRNGPARKHFLTAHRLSAQAEDPAVQANVCASLSHLSTTMHQTEAALGYAAEGLAHSRRAEVTAPVIAKLHAMHARALAARGDRFGTERALALAAEAVARQEPPGDWSAPFDEASLATEAAACWQDLGLAGPAEQQARAAVALRSPDRVRSRAMAMLALASLLCAQRRFDEAAEWGRAVLGAGGALSSARVLGMFDELADALRPHTGIADVETFIALRDTARNARTATS